MTAIEQAISDLYAVSSTGGYAHIAIDDGNMEDEWVQSCVVLANRKLSNPHDEEEKELARLSLNLLNLLVPLTYKERMKVYLRGEDIAAEVGDSSNA